MRSKEPVRIELLTELKEFRMVERLQRTIWGMPERDILPYRFLRSLTAGGGVVLGAFTPRGKMIGFSFGFPGWRNGERIFYSEQTGVHPQYQNQGVGFLLKKAQRDYVRSSGIPRIIWTYNPLLSRNAYFNFRKLGVKVCRYKVNYYGQMRDELNRRLGGDRLEVDWWLDDPVVLRRMRGDFSPAFPEIDAQCMLSARRQEELPFALPMKGAPTHPFLLLEVPGDYPALARNFPEIARKWRLLTRKFFLLLFENNYQAVDFLSRKIQGKTHFFYVLKKSQ